MNTEGMVALEAAVRSHVSPVIAKERITAALLEEVKPLLHAHWLEIATFRDEIPLDPDYALYQRLDEAGQSLCLTARLEGELIGYSVFLIRRPPHYQSTLSAINDVIWVHPLYRQGRLGLGLIRQSEAHLRALGVRKMVWHAKPGTQLHRLLARLGYVLDEVMFARLL